MRTLSKQNVIDIINGCTILGTGGGGTLEGGLALIEKDFEEGKKFILADLDEIPDDAYIATPYVCGSVSPLSDEEEAKYKDLPTMKVTEAMRAFLAMEEHYGKSFYGVISTELGGENTADALHIAAQLGKVIVDADPAGRSVPELQHSTYYINNLPITPIACASPFGDTLVITNVVDDFRAEAMVRSLSVACKNLLGVVDHPTTGKILKTSVIPGAISYAMAVGEIARIANENGEDPAIKIVSFAGGKMLFRGVVLASQWQDIEGFTIGDFELSGMDGYQGESYKVWFKNEHIISWRNGVVDVTVPDLICVLDKNGIPVTNPFYENGMELTVFALPAPKEWLTERGLEVFGPRSFGFDVEYHPIKSGMERK
jgi:hypothetical protein